MDVVLLKPSVETRRRYEAAERSLFMALATASQVSPEARRRLPSGAFDALADAAGKYVFGEAGYCVDVRNGSWWHWSPTTTIPLSAGTKVTPLCIPANSFVDAGCTSKTAPRVIFCKRERD